MINDDVRRRGFRLFADLLAYPRTNLAEAARECEALVAPESTEAAALLGAFVAFAEQASPGELEETYTSSFDLGASCHPYVGHYLFGERYERSTFMLELRQRYRAVGLETAAELPDHLALMLRYLAVCGDDEPAEELVGEALLPALAKMLRRSEEAGATEPGAPAADCAPAGGEAHDAGAPLASPYRDVLGALELVLERQLEAVGWAPEGGCADG